MSIWKLPAELRLHIYDFLLGPNPLCQPRTNYTGLQYSCKDIRQEFEPEIVKHTIVFLREVQSRCCAVYEDDMRYAEPTRMEDVYNLRFTRPVRHGMFSRSDPFMAILYLHFTTLTITMPPPASSSIASDPWLAISTYRKNTFALVHWLEKVRFWPDKPTVARIVYEWHAAPGNSADNWRPLNMRSIRRGFTLACWTSTSRTSGMVLQRKSLRNKLLSRPAGFER